MKKTFAVAAAIALLLTGCRSKSVQKFAALDQVGSESEKVVSSDGKQFDFSGECETSQPEQVSDVVFATKTDFSSNWKELFSYVAGIDQIDQEHLVTAKDQMGNNVLYEDEQNKADASVADSGFFSFFCGDSYSCPWSEYPITKVAVAGEEGFGSETLELDGKEYSAKEIADFAENWLNSKWKKFEPDLDFKTGLIIEKKSGENSVIAVEIWKYYKGVKLCNCDLVESAPPETGVYTQTRNSEMALIMTSFGKVSGFTTGNSTLEVKSEGKAAEKLISPQYAVDAAQKKFSRYNKLSVVSLKLKYVTTYQTNFAPETDTGVEHAAAPVWEILIKPDYPDFSKAETYSFPDLKYINVNALTGEITFELGENNRSRGI